MRGILEEIVDGAIGAIIVSSFTRLSRDEDRIDGMIIKRTCRDNDAVIITPEKLYDFSKDTDDDLADLQFFFSKIQKRMNLKAMLRGEYEKAKQGGFVGRSLSVGYDYKWEEVETRKGRKFKADLVINAQEADIVRLICEEMFPKTFYRQTAVIVNERAQRGEVMYFPIKSTKIRERHGGATHRPWKENDIRRIVTHELYTGRLRYAPRSRYFRGAEPVVAYRPDLRIISDEVYERNQRIVAERKKLYPRVKGSPYALSGLLRCPRCGAKMYGRGVKKTQLTRSGVRYKQYTCAAYNKSGRTVCEGYSVTESVALKVVLPMLTRLIQESLRPHLEQVARDGATRAIRTDIEQAIKAEITSINAQIDNLLRYARDGAITSQQLRNENFKLLSKKAELEAKLRGFKTEKVTQDEIVKVFEVFDHQFDQVLERTAGNPQRFNPLVRLFFDDMTLVARLRGRGWRKGYKEGQPLPEERGRIVEFSLNPLFETYVLSEGGSLPDCLEGARWKRVTDSVKLATR